MTDPETQTEPLIRAPSQETAGAPARRPPQAFKVAGITLLACVLIAGQALIAYFVLSQRSDIQSLQQQNNKMKSDLQRGRAAGVPMQIHTPMNALPILEDDFVDKEVFTKKPRKMPNSRKATQCQLQAAGLKPGQLPDFQPVCDEQGLYQPQQCWHTQCWCVDPVSGQEIVGSIQRGGAYCGEVKDDMGKDSMTMD